MTAKKKFSYTIAKNPVASGEHDEFQVEAYDHSASESPASAQVLYVGTLKECGSFMTGLVFEDFGENRKKRNTQIKYLYRDACNYKIVNEAIISGELTREQQKTILGCLDLRAFFIPGQVGLPELKFENETEDDDCWFELSEGFAVLCDQEPTVDITAEDLTANFLAAKGNWIGG